MNNDARGTYSINSQIKFKNTMLKSSLCDFSDAYILVKAWLLYSKHLEVYSNITEMSQMLL